MRQRKLLVLVVVLSILCFAGRCGSKKIQEGVGRDTMSNVEHHRNGATSVWFTHDELIGYCTVDTELGDWAEYLLREYDGEVIFEYKDMNITDPEASFWGVSQCGNIGNESGTEAVILLSLTPLEELPPKPTVGQ